MTLSRSGGLHGIDHLVILVRDLGAARRGFERLGFTLTDRADHSAAMGTANTCLMFADDYVELLTVIHPTDANAPWRQRLEDGTGTRPGQWGPGLSVVALATGDADETYRSLTAAGVDAESPLRFSRDVETPDGTRAASFSITRLAPTATPTVPMFACYHHTPELVWRPEWQTHDNGAVGLGAVWAMIDRPQDVEAAYRKLFGAERVNLGDDKSLTVHSGETPIHFVTPAQYAARYPETDLAGLSAQPGLAGFSVRVADLAHARHFMATHGIPCHGDAGRIWVSPKEACGALIEFVKAS